MIVAQLRDFVLTIASMYRDNPFHNFEHATHVALSVGMFLSKIVATEDKISDEDSATDYDEMVASTLHDQTYGITSDPLTQLACIFSALVHDVDHTGVPNTLLEKEDEVLSAAYGNKSIAEQNSFDIAWCLLMAPKYSGLRGAIYSDANEMERFRQLVVNSVMATDIMDKQANGFRRARWDRAFKEEDTGLYAGMDSMNRKATIVIEHIIQGSDIAHTMQHWRVYIKWNERLFDEMYAAYKEGRSDKNPYENWYKGEIGFFDFYIIPLAQKLKTCGVFGDLSDQYLNAAKNNRQKWEENGFELVKQYMAKHSSQA
jgi:hypothetical protein